MQPPALIVKLKGAQAAQLFGTGTPGLGTAPMQGVTFFGKTAAGRGMDFEVARFSKAKLAKGSLAAKGATARTVELEGARLVTTKNGVVLHANKVIPGCEVGPAKSSVLGATSAKGAIPGAAKGAIPGAAKAKAAAVAAKGAAGSGTIWTGTGLGLGLGLGLGAWGPALLLGTAGLVAAGVYLYKRNQELEEDELAAEDGIRDAVFDE
jgi:hypothetical protein